MDAIKHPINHKNQPVDLKTLSLGLSLSGGGYRAAAFHLGTLAYLHRVGLLSQLRTISTVSGGTFTGMAYILSLVKEESFPEFFQNYYAFLRDRNLISLGLETLKQGKIQVPSGRHNLILAMAQVYAETLLSDLGGQPYTLGTILNANIPVPEVVFNTTEFRHGVAFRFQRSGNPKARIGNRHLSVPKGEAAKIRLADILAASSCFPGGFEPIAFPDDFVWPENQVPQAVREAVYAPPVEGPIALMDGGIFDNQGATSLVLADERNIEDLGLVIISDVDERKPDLFAYPRENSQQRRSLLGRLTLGQVDWLLRVFIVACFVTVGSVGYELWQKLQRGSFLVWPDLFTSIIPLLLALFALLSLWGVRRLIRNDLLPRIPQEGRRGWQALRRLTIDQFLYLLELRLKSLLALTSSVFMRRIRGLVLNRIYADWHYRGKVIANFIYELASGHQPRFDKLPGLDAPSPQLQKILDDACHMPTTLWFDTAEQLSTVVVAGQATVCFNLMDYIVKTYGKEVASYPPAIKDFWWELLEDWQQFSDQPNLLLEQLRSEI